MELSNVIPFRKFSNFEKALERVSTLEFQICLMFESLQDAFQSLEFPRSFRILAICQNMLLLPLYANIIFRTWPCLRS